MSSLLLGEHRGYIADVARLRAFERAIQLAVSPGDSVLDLGSGTGVLGLFALRAGARHVYAVDSSPMAAVARKVLRANGAADRSTVLRQHSLTVQLPERVDVVVADQLGAFGVEAGAFEAFADARLRHLKPGGTLIPGRIDHLLAPVDSTETWADVSFWDAPHSDVDVTAVSPLARNVRYFTTLPSDDLLGPAVRISSTDTGDPAALPIRGAQRLAIERPGTLHGVAAWFEAHLAEGISITNGPVADERLGRSHVFLPVDAPVEVVPGCSVEAEVHADPRSDVHRWTITVRDASDAELARSTHSSVDGTPVTREDLARARPDATPRTTPAGAAWQTVLALCDGATTRQEIEAVVAERHAALLPDDGAVSAFVARVLATDTE